MLRDDAVYIFGKGWKLTCLQCGQEFYAKRQDAQYDSANCRKAASRRKAQMRRAASQAISHIDYIRRFMQKYPDLEIVGALELERISLALSVTPAVVTDTRATVTLAGRTDKACFQCGKITFVSPASGLCIECIKQTTE